MANDTIIDEIFQSIVTHSVNAMKVSDTDNFPIIRSIFGKLSFQMTKKFMSENAGPYRQFYEFMAFAYPLLRQSYSSSLLDLIVLFHTQKNTDFSWIEFAEEYDGIHESATALLEASYGWQGVIVVQRTPAMWVRGTRRADIYNLDEIGSLSIDDRPADQPEVTQTGEGEAPIGEPKSDAGTRSLLSFLKAKYNSANFTFIHIRSCDQFFKLRESDFLHDAIAKVLIVSHWGDERCNQIGSYLLTLGYVSWLPEFIAGHFVFVRGDNDSSASSLATDTPTVRNLIPPITEFSLTSQYTRRARVAPCKLEMVGVHFPKTGGASLLLGLNEHYGDWLYEDYQHDPGNPLTNKERPPILGAFTKAVFGHFRADRYRNYNPGFLFTFVRDPFDLLLSNYFFLRDHLGDTTNPEVILFKEKRLSLKEYAAISGMGYFAYFGNIEPSAFDFVGNYANYEADLKVLGQLTGIKFPQSTRNRFENTPERQEMEADASLRAQVMDYLRADYTIYEKMLKQSDRS